MLGLVPHGGVLKSEEVPEVLARRVDHVRVLREAGGEVGGIEDVVPRGVAAGRRVGSARSSSARPPGGGGQGSGVHRPGGRVDVRLEGLVVSARRGRRRRRRRQGPAEEGGIAVEDRRRRYRDGGEPREGQKARVAAAASPSVPTERRVAEESERARHGDDEQDGAEDDDRAQVEDQRIIQPEKNEKCVCTYRACSLLYTADDDAVVVFRFEGWGGGEYCTE